MASLDESRSIVKKVSTLRVTSEPDALAAALRKAGAKLYRLAATIDGGRS
jgi:hypothetical protein